MEDKVQTERVAMSLSAQEIKEILETLVNSGWDEAQVSIGDATVTVSKTGRLPLPAASPSSISAPAAPPRPAADSAPVAALPEAAPASEEAPQTGVDDHVVLAPSVGIIWRAPEPGAAAFVEVGDRIDAGVTVCICEVMKLFQHVITEVAGVVTTIHVGNGEHVEYGQRLFTVTPDGS